MLVRDITGFLQKITPKKIHQYNIWRPLLTNFEEKKLGQLGFLARKLALKCFTAA